jgi:hypothetical protein
MNESDPSSSNRPDPGQPDGGSDYPPLYPERLTWAVLLGKWVDLARSALALGNDPASQALKKLVPDIIMLQALCHALQEMNDLPLDEQQLGCLRAHWLIDKHQAQIHQTWPAEEPLPQALEELIADAAKALQLAQDRINAADTSSTDS